MKKEFRADELMVEIYPDRAAMAHAAAADTILKINELLAKQPVVNIIFAAAPSQNEFLDALSQNRVEWNRVRAFHMDEYIGLDENAPQRFGSFLKQKIFHKLSFLEVHYINGNSVNAEAECGKYASLLRQYPVDIVCMGIGENGHIAFNDPPVADFKDQQLVKVVDLDMVCRQQQVNDGCFSSINKVPLQAVTLTIPALMAAKYVYCMVPGRTKAPAVYNTLNKDVIEQFPSTILRTHPDAILYLDALSSSKLNTATETI